MTEQSFYTFMTFFLNNVLTAFVFTMKINGVQNKTNQTNGLLVWNNVTKLSYFGELSP